MIQVKLYETVYTPQDIEHAQSEALEGFANSADLDEGYIGFAEQPIGWELEEKLNEIIEENDWDIGYTFELNGETYKIVG